MRAREIVGLTALFFLTSVAGIARAAAPESGGPASATPEAAAGADPSSMPPGHPAVDDGNPHARTRGSTMPGMFEPPEDVERPDPSLPPATIAVELRDADDRPLPHEEVTLGAVINSVAKGDSRRHTLGTTDDHGRAVFRDLDTASNTAYRVSSHYQGGLFAAAPFRLEPSKPMLVILHVYPVVHDLQGALVVVEATLAGEVREDRIQLEEILNFYNLGRTAWQPEGVHLSLPEGYKALNAQASMSDQGVDEGEGGANLRGTFSPGRHSIQFQWQLPLGGNDQDVDFQVGLPPHVAIGRVMIPVASKIELAVAGFPPAQVRHDAQGQRFLVTERQMRPEDAKLTALTVGIHGLPTAGPDRVIASVLSACGIVVGLWLSLSRRSQRVPSTSGTKAARNVLLEELAELEQARAAGDVGPKTYDRARRDLIDALARSLAPSGA
jgi:hypothetical protein